MCESRRKGPMLPTVHIWKSDQLWIQFSPFLFTWVSGIVHHPESRRTKARYEFRSGTFEKFLQCNSSKMGKDPKFGLNISLGNFRSNSKNCLYLEYLNDDVKKWKLLLSVLYIQSLIIHFTGGKTKESRQMIMLNQTCTPALPWWYGLDKIVRRRGERGWHQNRPCDCWNTPRNIFT